ncbi:MAG TPA: PQQ-binding-like beta-propeller repeat protein [Acetobacteraceae bacterium]|nr:PQQ-binding-like beta-propeller repeat protein [Acetobacteraceae bacterium]
MSRARIIRGPSLPRRAALLAPLALAGCGDWFGSSKKPLPGVRLDVLPPPRTLSVDTTNTSPITLPPPQRNPDWPQVGGNVEHRMGSLAAGTSLQIAWRASIGEGASYRRMLTAQPIVAGGNVFTMDSAGVVRAFRLADGSQLWRFNTKAQKDRSQELGGGISYDSGALYAATGRAEVVAIDAAKGVLRWRQAIGQPARSAPTISGGTLYVPTIAAQLLALGTADGKQIWSYQGRGALVGLLGEPSPAIGNGLVIAGFASGELTALSLDSGTVQWSDNLGAVLGANSPADISAVHALPVVDGSEVYAISLGQLFVDEDIHSGRRVYYLEVAGSETPTVAGDWLFLLTADQRLAAIQRHVGLVRWITVMPRFTDPKHEKGPILWQGPVLAGGRLLLTSDKGELAAIEPGSGKILERQRLPGPAAMAPVVADATVLVLLRDGTLTAWR